MRKTAISGKRCPEYHIYKSFINLFLRLMILWLAFAENRVMRTSAKKNVSSLLEMVKVDIKRLSTHFKA